MNNMFVRWLNVSPVSRLFNQRGYLQLPAVSGTYNFETYINLAFMFRFNNQSDETSELNYNLSLLQSSYEEIFSSSSFVWCVAFLTNTIVSDTEEPQRVLVRYRLNESNLVGNRTYESIGLTFLPSNIEQYAGQVLPGTALRIEAWLPACNTNGSIATSFDGGNLLTSVLSTTSDSRQGNVFSICEPTATEIDFTSPNSAAPDFSLPFVFQSQVTGFPNSNYRPTT